VGDLGHWGWYRENMFAAQSAGDEAEDKRWFAIKPMNCPGHCADLQARTESYRDLPIRLAEFGAVHRMSPSAALHGLLRVRGFTQDDAHIFCTRTSLPKMPEDQRPDLSVYATSASRTIFSSNSRPDPKKRVGTDAMWDHAEVCCATLLDTIAARSGNRIKVGVNPGEGTFYGPKFEYVLRDCDRARLAVRHTQVDFNLPALRRVLYRRGRAKKQPVMVHRAICGSLERFTGILIENFAALPASGCAKAGRDRHHHAGGDGYAAKSMRPRENSDCASISTCATRRSTTRSASTRSAKCR